MSDQNLNDQITLDQRLTNALEAAPAIAIPSDFTQRLMQRLPVQRQTSRMPLISSPGIGRRVAFAAVFVLIAAMLAISLLAHHNVALTAVEGSLTVEFILLTAWMSLRPQTLR